VQRRRRRRNMQKHAPPHEEFIKAPTVAWLNSHPIK